jgi:hypothetical protein
MPAPNILQRKIPFKSLVSDNASAGTAGPKPVAPFWFDGLVMNGFFIIRAH